MEFFFLFNCGCAYLIFLSNCACAHFIWFVALFQKKLSDISGFITLENFFCSDESFCGCFAVIIVLVNQLMVKGLNDMFDHAELFGKTWLGAYSALCFSCGYFAYDQLDMLRYRLYSGWIPSILMHHLILLICFTLALYRMVTINYLILTLVCEVHRIFWTPIPTILFLSCYIKSCTWWTNKSTTLIVLSWHSLHPWMHDTYKGPNGSI